MVIFILEVYFGQISQVNYYITEFKNTSFGKVVGHGYGASFSWFEILGLVSFILLQVDEIIYSYIR
jgi:hypothetical protein